VRERSRGTPDYKTLFVREASGEAQAPPEETNVNILAASRRGVHPRDGEWGGGGGGGGGGGWISADRAREDYVSSIMPGAEVRGYRAPAERRTDGRTDRQTDKDGEEGKGDPLGYRVS